MSVLLKHNTTCLVLCILSRVCVWVCASHPLQAQQQVPGSGERGPLGAYGGGDDVAEVPQLVAALHDESQGVVVVGCQLVAVQDHHLSTGHLVLGHTKTQTKVCGFITPCLVR